MALERSTWGFAGVTFPLTTNPANPLLVDGEPSISTALAYFKAMLVQYLGARWAVECARCGLDSVASTIVVDSVHYDPQPYLREQQFKFPLLAIFRSSESHEGKTGLYAGAKETWSVLWIMSPLTSAQMEIMSPFPRLVSLVLQNRSQEGGDAAYNANERVWAASGTDAIALRTTTFGLWDAGEGLPFPGVFMTFAVESRQTDVADAFDPLEATQTSIDLTDPATDTTVEDIAIVLNQG